MLPFFDDSQKNEPPPALRGHLPVGEAGESAAAGNLIRHGLMAAPPSPKGKAHQTWSLHGLSFLRPSLIGFRQEQALALH